METSTNVPALRWGLLPLRVAVGLVFIVHGGQKLFTFGLSGTADIMQKIGIPIATIAAAVVIAAELLGGTAIVAGLWTRFAGAVLAIEMVVAIFAARLGGGFFTPYGYEYELVLLGACITFALTGSGAPSLDSLLHRPEHART